MADWRRFLKIIIGAAGGVLLALLAFVVAVNPYGNLPVSAMTRHVIMDDNQRFQYPAVIRSGNYDSVVVGTSTARLLSPASLERAFGGNFANLAMNSGTAWEQWRLVELFLREVVKPRTLIVGADTVWCDQEADVNRVTPRGFPEWMFDDNPVNDLPYMLNGKSVEIAGRRVGYALGLVRERMGSDGYEVFTPPESAYDPVKVKVKIWGANPAPIRAQQPAYRATDAERASWRFPALDWLDDMLKRWPGQKVVMLMPVHVNAQPQPGSKDAAMEEECKRRMGEVAGRHGAHVVDFRRPSRLTSNDDNYWDALHYRIGIAEQIVVELQRAVTSGEQAGDADWRYVAGPLKR